MTQCTIRILPADSDRFDVRYDDIPSHKVSKARLEDILKTGSADCRFYSDAQFRELGSALFDLLDGTGGRLGAEMEKAEDEGEDLNLRLDLPPELDILPFEAMFSDGFITADREVNLFRLASGKGGGKSLVPEKRPLKVLFMACSPEGGDGLDFEREEELILERTEKLHLNLEVEDSGSLDGLRDMVEGLGGFDVAHLSGHAGIDGELGPVFYMEDETGRKDKVGPERLRRAFRGFRPRVLFLSGCSTGGREAGRDAPSFAEQMVQGGIPFVMGWAWPVADVAATLLAAQLFRYLSMGKGVGEAARMARQEVRKAHGAWALFRIYCSAARPGAVVAAGQGIRPPTMRKTLYRTLEHSGVRVLEQGFVGRRRQIQRGVRVLRGFEEQKGLLITGAAGVGKSCLAGKFIERFKQKKLVVVHGELETGDLFSKLIQLFERYGIQSGLEALHADSPPEERIAALFRQAFRELPAIVYLDDFEQNLERAVAGPSDEDDAFVVKRNSDALPLVRGLLRALPWAEGDANIIVSSRYPFRLEHMGADLPETNLATIPLMSMREADLKKKIEKLEHIAASDHRRLYVEAGKGNPRLLEWLDKIAAEEEKYDLTDLKNRVRGKQADYVAEYLFDIMTETEGEGFGTFLRNASVFRQPVPTDAMALFGTNPQIQRAAWLTLLERETRPDGDTFWVHPMIREMEWRKLPAPDRKSAHAAAAEWYANALANADEHPFAWLSEAVHHCLGSGRVRQACGYAIDLGQTMKNMQLYRERAAMQLEVAEHVAGETIEEAIRDGDGNVAVLFSNLGQAYNMLGDYPNTIKWTEKALEMDRELFGENHPDTAIDYNNLGEAYRALGEYGKAIDYYERALAIDRKNFGENHPQVAIYTNNLGSAYDSLGEYGKAIDYFERALAIDRKNFGENHPDTASDYNNLGMAYYNLGEYRKAAEFIERTLAIFVRFLGPDHPDTKTVRNNLEMARKAAES